MVDPPTSTHPSSLGNLYGRCRDIYLVTREARKSRNGESVTQSDYVLSNAWLDEQRRLAAIEEIFDPATFRHLSTIGIGPGWSCMELGGGGGSVARWMAGQVGPSGSVFVTDLDTRFLDEIDLPNIEVRVHDIRTDLLDRVFDVIHARLVLEHLPERIEVLRKLIGALRPGGWLLVESGDLTCGRHLPASRQFVMPERLRSTVRRLFRAIEVVGEPVGLDGEFARELPHHLVEAGLVEIDAEMCSRLVTGGSTRAAFYEFSYRQLTDAYLNTGLLAQRELSALIEACGDPRALMMSVPVVSAWGRRPA